MTTQAAVQLTKSIVGAEEAEALAGVIERGYLGIGADVKGFEDDLARYFGGQREVVCVSSGTAALHLALQACGIGPGDEVLVPTLTYVASFQAIGATGATPIACDVNLETGGIDVTDAARRVTHRARAIMPVHYSGGVGALGEVYSLASRLNLRVIEDAAHAFGSSHRGELVGSFGDVVCFSFDGIKNITSGEGGAVLTSDPEVAARVRDLRLLSVEKDTEKRYAGQRSWEFDVLEQGWRYHMSNLFAAIGRVQLRRFEGEFKPKRVDLAKRYIELLEGEPGLALFAIDYGCVVPHMFVVRVLEGRRDELRQALLDHGVQCGIHYKPNHLLSLYGAGRDRLPNAERLYEELLTLPLHPALSHEEQDHVVRVIQKTLESIDSSRELKNGE